MEARNPELPPRPPGAVSALVRGFNALTGNLSVILFPIALDVFLWLGPRLKMEALFTSTLQQMLKLQGSEPTLFPPNFPAATPAQIHTALQGINIFARLRTYPMGVFSLMLDNASATSPLGARSDWEIQGWFTLLGWFLLLTCIGLMLGSLYFYCVSRVALSPQKGPGLLRAMFNSLLLWGIWTFVLLIAYPILMVAVYFLLNNPLVVILLFLLLAWPVTWVCLLVFFSTHAVFTGSKNAFASVVQNFRVLRYGMPPMGWFALMAVIISRGMDLLWLIPPADTWMAAVGILGHAFISTGLLAASFIFYRDLNAWVEEALQWVKTHQVTSAHA